LNMRHRTNQQRHHNNDPTTSNSNAAATNTGPSLTKASSFGDGDAAAGLSPIDEQRIKVSQQELIENDNGGGVDGQQQQQPFHTDPKQPDKITDRSQYTQNNKPHNSSNDNKKVIVLGLNISSLSRKYQFIVCAGGVFAFSLVYGYLQELISVTLCNRQLGLFLAMFQFMGYFGWSGILKNIGRDDTTASSSPTSLKGKGKQIMNYRRFRKRASIPPIVSFSSLDENAVVDAAIQMEEEERQPDKINTSTTTNNNNNKAINKPKVPFRFYILLSCLRAIDTGCTNMAMAYINYPAKTLMKSCRVVFTMLLGSIVNKRKYAIIDYGIVIVMVTGLGLFLHADSSHSSAIFELRGVLLLCMSLTCDGVSNNISERLMNQYDIGQDEYIFRQYSIATLGIFIAALVQGEVLEGIKYLSQPGTYNELLEHSTTPSWSVKGKIITMIVFSSAGYFAGSCSSAITKEFGALAMTITSTARKAMTLFISFLMFDHVCTMEHVSGIVLFIAALITKSVRTSKKGHPGGQYRMANKGHGDDEKVEGEEQKDEERTALLESYSSRQVEMGNHVGAGNTFKRRISNIGLKQRYPPPLIV